MPKFHRQAAWSYVAEPAFRTAILKKRTNLATRLTRNTTVTFSDSLTPASGSPSISSPGPGMAGCEDKWSFSTFGKGKLDFVLDGVIGDEGLEGEVTEGPRDKWAILRDESEWVELDVSAASF